MNVLRHDNISIHAKVEADAHVFKALNEQSEQLDGCEMRLTVATTKGYKMGLPGFLKAPEPTRHKANLCPTASAVEST